MKTEHKESTSDYQAGVWILVECQNRSIHSLTHELLTRAVKLAEKLKTHCGAIIMGYEINPDDIKALIHHGADLVVSIQDPLLDHFLIEPHSECMIQIIQKYNPTIILAGASTTGRTLMPYVAAKIDTGLTADCTSLDIEDQTDNLLQTRPAIGGNILATIKTATHRPQMATVRPRSTMPSPYMPHRQGQIINLEPTEKLRSRVKQTGFIPSPNSKDLHDSKVIVAAGKGIKQPQNLDNVYQLAKLLNGMVGASRDIVDRNWLSYRHQVGLSGTTVNPDLYIAAGISGAIQHLAGMQTSKYIISINSDPNAQILQISQLGLIADVQVILPVLNRKIQLAQSEGVDQL